MVNLLSISLSSYPLSIFIKQLSSLMISFFLSSLSG